MKIIFNKHSGSLPRTGSGRTLRLAVSSGQTCRSAIAGALGGAIASLLAPPETAWADTIIALPDESLTQTLPDGTSVTMSLRDQHVIVSPSVVAAQTSRNIWASGVVRVDIEGKAGASRLTPGYLIGCQASLGAKAGGSFNTDSKGNVGTGLTAGAIGSALSANDLQGAATALGPVVGPYLPSGNISATLAPGQTRDITMLRIEEPDDYGNQKFDNYFAFAGNHGGITYTDVSFKVDDCAGYAQARPYARVRINNPRTRSWMTVWGAPFSIG